MTPEDHGMHSYENVEYERRMIPEEFPNMKFSNRGCCLWIPFLGSSKQPSGSGVAWWQRIQVAENEDRWWVRGWIALMKVREWSEVVAGPQWKTFNRRFNMNRGIRHPDFRYDSFNYALNFDEGAKQDDLVDEDVRYRGFSTRYALIPASAKSSMDLDNDGHAFV